MIETHDIIKFPSPELIKFPIGEGIGRIIWNKVRYRPKEEHLHEFIVNVLHWTLGRKWHSEQVSKSPAERHDIMRWLKTRYDFLTHLLLLGYTTKHRVIPLGEVRELVSLAADVYYLQLVNELPRQLVERLKTYEGFQGARYEIAVAASLVRAGFDIHWTEAEKGKKHHEFDAIHKFTGEILAVEAKSRGRKGTFHREGEVPNLTNIKGDIFGLYNEAMEQNPGDKPFGVFIDINVPHQHEVPVTDKTWIKDIFQKIKEKNGAIFGSVIPTFIAITNSAWHYEGKERAKAGEFLLLIPNHPVHPFNNRITLEAVKRALTVFSDIPDEE